MRRFLGGLITGAILTASVVIGYNVLAGNVVDTNVHEVRTGETWAQIAAAHGYVQLAPGSSTDSVVNTPADQLQVFNNVSPTSSDSAQPRVGWGLQAHSSPPPTPPSSTTTSTTAPPPPSSTTTTSVPSSTSTSTTPGTTTTTPASTTTVAPATTVAPSTTEPTPGGDFVADFDTAADFDLFEWQFRASTNSTSLPHQAQHNMACDGPDTFRTVNGGQRTGTDVGDMRYWCSPGAPTNGHLMTSVQTVEVAVLSFSPTRVFNNVRRVCFDINMNNLGEGKWVNLFVIPNADVVRLGGRLDYSSGNASLDPGQPAIPPGGYNLVFLRGTTLGYSDNSGTIRFEWWGAHAGNMEPTAGPRHPLCVEDLENGQLRYSIYRPETRTVGVRTGPGSLPDGDVRVIWQDGSYNPDKHGPPADGSLTWHYDNLTVTER